MNRKQPGSLSQEAVDTAANAVSKINLTDCVSHGFATFIDQLVDEVPVITRFGLLTQLLPTALTLAGRKTLVRISKTFELPNILWTCDLRPSGQGKTVVQDMIVKAFEHIENETTCLQDGDDARSGHVRITEGTLEGILSHLTATKGLAFFTPTEVSAQLQQYSSLNLNGASTVNTFLDLHDGTPIMKILKGDSIRIGRNRTNLMTASQPLSIIPLFQATDGRGILPRFLFATGDFKEAEIPIQDRHAIEQSSPECDTSSLWNEMLRTSSPNAETDQESTDDDQSQAEETNSLLPLLKTIARMITLTRADLDDDECLTFKLSKAAALTANNATKVMQRLAAEEVGRDAIVDFYNKRTTMHYRIALALYLLETGLQQLRSQNISAISLKIPPSCMGGAVRLSLAYNAVHLAFLTTSSPTALSADESVHVYWKTRLFTYLLRAGPHANTVKIRVLLNNSKKTPGEYLCRKHLIIHLSVLFMRAGLCHISQLCPNTQLEIPLNPSFKRAIMQVQPLSGVDRLSTIPFPKGITVRSVPWDHYSKQPESVRFIKERLNVDVNTLSHEMAQGSVRTSPSSQPQH